jgi:hypothetical protein
MAKAIINHRSYSEFSPSPADVLAKAKAGEGAKSQNAT